MANARGYIFNSDILADASARANIQALYPDIFFALDNDELRQVFAPVDAEANQAKSRSRKWGAVAVSLGAYSLFSATALPLLHDLHVGEAIERAAALSCAVAGILSVVIGLFGVMYAKSKRQWMRNRYITERLRQFHFQSMIALLPEILSSEDEFQKQRRALFEQFKGAQIQGASAKLSAMLEDELERDGWLFANRPIGAIGADDAKYRQFVAAYMQLRVEAQIDFCEHKLARRGIFSNSPRDQVSLFGALALASVLGALLLHVSGAIGALGAVSFLASPYLHVLGLWCFAGAMTVRTLEEGYRPQREVERYRQYRSALISVRDRLAGASNPSEVIAAMKQLEQTSYEEMVNFLKAYSEAKFVM